MTIEVPAEDLTTTYEVISVETAHGQATVRFANPYYSGACIGPCEQPVIDPETGLPTGETHTVMVDQDPNLPVVKQIVVPLTEAGAVDHDAFIERLADQARGVRARMDAARLRQSASGFDALVGLTTPSP